MFKSALNEIITQDYKAIEKISRLIALTVNGFNVIYLG